MALLPLIVTIKPDCNGIIGSIWFEKDWIDFATIQREKRYCLRLEITRTIRHLRLDEIRDMTPKNQVQIRIYCIWIDLQIRQFRINLKRVFHLASISAPICQH